MTDKELNKQMGTILKELRLKNGLTMQQASDHLGFKHRASIADYESGKATISLYNLKRLCDFYNTDYRDVLARIWLS